MKDAQPELLVKTIDESQQKFLQITRNLLKRKHRKKSKSLKTKVDNHKLEVLKFQINHHNRIRNMFVNTSIVCKFPNATKIHAVNLIDIFLPSSCHLQPTVFGFEIPEVAEITAVQFVPLFICLSMKLE